MRHARVLAVSAVAVSLLAAVAYAQTAVTPLPDNTPVRTASLEVDFSKTTWGDAKADMQKSKIVCTYELGDNPKYAVMAERDVQFDSLE